MPTLVELIKERFKDLTEIQKLAIPRILNGENVLIMAPTGFGKTESALLPVLEKINKKEPGIQALYISPLRALSRDLKQRFDWWCDRLEISHDARTGDTTAHERTKHRNKPPQILLTTPESLQALFIGKVMREHLKKIKFVIVDEIHDILDTKRGSQLSMALERLAEVANFQRLGLSATVSNEAEAAKLLFGERQYAIAEVGKKRALDITIENLHSQDQRIKRLKELSETNRSLIFVNTRAIAEEVGATLKKEGAPIDVHHGSLSKEVRLSAEDKFKSGETKSLIATSSLELGIDVGDVNLVVQFSSPRQVARLVQRVGRSGHALDKTPKGIVITTDLDDYLEAEAILSLLKNGWMEDKKVQRGAYDVIAHQVIGVCLDNFGNLNLRDVHKILSRSYAYDISYEKLKLVALQLYSESILSYNDNGDEFLIRPTRNAREYYYSNLSTIPKEKKYFMKNISSNSNVALLDEKFVLNLEIGSSFLAKGQPWMVIDITENEVLVDPSVASEISIPEWIGEEIPVDLQVAQNVLELRRLRKESDMKSNEAVMELVGEVIIIHTCLGTKINETISRIFSYNLSKLVGETVRSVVDPYRIIVKLPFPLDEKHLLPALKTPSIRATLERSLEESFLMKMMFTHVARLFGLLAPDAKISGRFIYAMRNSIIYDECLRTIFSRFFDVDRTEKILPDLKIKVEKREKFSKLAQLGIDRLSSGEAIGSFEPRKEMVMAFKERTLSKTLELQCLNCGATKLLYLYTAPTDPKQIKCAKCNQQALTIKGERRSAEEKAQMASLIRNYGKNALIALASYGVGPRVAEYTLKRLHRTEDEFYLDLIEAQKNFIKNKKYWKI
ncbi:MAG: DEAD/DEAH box helicase [Candidatus Micrarchaeota archaeon]